MKNLFGGRRVLIAVAVIALIATAILVTGTSREAQAAANCTYYSDATYTVAVGQFGTDCCNNPVAWGRKTRYAQCGGCFPCFPPPR